MLNMITLGADLRERGIGLKVLKQGIDTATAGDPHVRDAVGPGRVASQADRGQYSRRTGRRPSPRRYAGEPTVAPITDMPKVLRTNVYGHLNKRRVDITPVKITLVTEPPAPRSRTCPTCGHEPTTRAEAAHQHTDIAVTWLHPDPDHRGTVISRHHCRHCEPGSRHSTSPASSAATSPSSPAHSPRGPRTATCKPVRRCLTAAGWTVTPALLCLDDYFLGDAVPIARAAFDDEDLITAMREQLYPKFVASAIEPEVVADRVVTGIRDRSAHIMVPLRWQPISALGRIVNPLTDRSHERNTRGQCSASSKPRPR